MNIKRATYLVFLMSIIIIAIIAIISILLEEKINIDLTTSFLSLIGGTIGLMISLFFFSDNKKTILIITVILLALSGYIAFNHGVNVAYDGLDIKIEGASETLSQTEHSMSLVAKLTRDLASKVTDTKDKEGLLWIAGQADRIAAESESLKNSVAGLAYQEPEAQEKILRDVLKYHGMADDIIEELNFGIIDKYQENSSLKQEIAELKQAISKKDKKLEDLFAQQKHTLRVRDSLNLKISDLKVEMLALNSRIQRAVGDDGSELNKALLDSLDALGKQFTELTAQKDRLEEQLKNVKPFFIENGELSIENVGTHKKSGDYKAGQIRNKDLLLTLSPRANPNYLDSLKNEYVLTAEIVYLEPKRDAGIVHRLIIVVKPNQDFKQTITLPRPLGIGPVFITIYWGDDKQEVLWRDDIKSSRFLDKSK